MAVLAVGLGLGLLGLWQWSRNPALIATLLATMAFAVVAGIVVLERRRRAARNDRLALQASIDDIIARVDLDGHEAGRTGLRGASARTRPLTITRTPVGRGRSSHFLNRLELDYPDDAKVALVEKGLSSDSNELRFWRRADEGDPLVLHTEVYDTVEPVRVVDGEAISVMYLPYLPELERERSVLRAAFRADMMAIVAAVADFNGRNIVASGAAGTNDAPTFEAVRPGRSELAFRLDVPWRTAKRLQESWDAAHESWQLVAADYRRLPRCLCHNDISPGNAVRLDGTTRFLDFGLAGTGPVGSDLHTVLRWSGDTIDDADHVESIFNTYLDALRPYVRTMELDDVRLAAWATFYLRYTNLKYSSSRHIHTFDTAVRHMGELGRQRLASQSSPSTVGEVPGRSHHRNSR